MRLPKLPSRRSGKFQVFTDGVPGSTFTITPGGTIHVVQPVDIMVGYESHRFTLTNVDIRWLE